MGDFNWLAIVVGAFVPMILGFIWYHPKLFGNAWMKSLGFTEKDVQSGNMPVIFGVAFLMAAVLAHTLSSYMGYHAEEEQVFTHGAFHGGLLALMTAVPVLISNSLFERKNWTNIGINAAYWFVAMAAIGAVVTLFA